MPFDVQDFKPVPVRLSPADLGISQEVYDALIWTRDGLESGALKEREFNMAAFEMETDCGTTRCIIGWMRAKLGYRLRCSMDDDTPLSRLAFPTTEEPEFYGDHGDITTAKAVAAIDNVLTVGTPKWASILPRPTP